MLFRQADYGCLTRVADGRGGSMMSNHIDLGTAEMIRVGLSQQETGFRGKSEHAGLLVALDIVMRCCAIPLADAVIAQAKQVVAKAVRAPPMATGPIDATSHSNPARLRSSPSIGVERKSFRATPTSPSSQRGPK